MEQQTKQPLNRNLAYLEETAKANGWVFKYEDNLDELYWSKPVISEDSKLIRLTDDFAFYIKANGEVEGVFVEYAKYNFFEHEESLRELLEKLKITDQLKTEELSEDLIKKLTEKIKSEALEAASFNVSDIFKPRTV